MALTLPAASACHMDDKVTAAVPFDSTDEGVELRLRLRIAAGQVAALAIENRRPAGLLAVLRGRRADEVPALVQRLFPICGHAHSLACAHAIAVARGDDGIGRAACRERVWRDVEIQAVAATCTKHKNQTKIISKQA